MGQEEKGADMARNVAAQIRRATRRRFSADEKIRIGLEGLRGEISVSELCTREGSYPSIYYRWSKAFLEAGKNRFTLDRRRDATKVEVLRHKEENEALGNVTPDHVYFCSREATVRRLADLKNKAIARRRERNANRPSPPGTTVPLNRDRL